MRRCRAGRPQDIAKWAWFAEKTEPPMSKQIGLRIQKFSIGLTFWKLLMADQ